MREDSGVDPPQIPGGAARCGLAEDAENRGSSFPLAGATWREGLLMARATALLLLLPWLLKRSSIPGLLRRLEFAARPAADPPRDPSRLLAVLVRLLSWKPLGANCLRRSLVLFYFLARNGHPATLRFGVALDGEDLAGHSWIELGGEAITESSDPYRSFRVIYSFPEETQRRARHEQEEEPLLGTQTHAA